MSEALRPKRWTEGLTGYHYLVLLVVALGWLFDTMDQWLYVLARGPALRDLMGPEATDAALKAAGGNVQAMFLFGWATGGLVFGMLGDRLGRTRTMAITVIMYAVFTGLSGLSQGYWDFMLYRFLTGLGIGGEFAAGAALVSEVFPKHARAAALGIMQACSALGNMMAGVIGLSVATLSESDDRWRFMFLAGLVPALLVFVIRFFLREPDSWKAAKAQAVAGEIELGSVRQLFGVPWLRRRVLVGIALAAVGVIGFWGIGTYSPDLMRQSLVPRDAQGVVVETEFAENVQAWVSTGLVSEATQQRLMAERTAADQPVLRQVLEQWTSIGVIAQNFGSFFGMLAFAFIAERIGRRPTFALSFILCALVVPITFHTLTDWWHIFVLLPILGCSTSLLFGGYAVYFPEMFPTRLRATGTGFCYNVARYIAIAGPALFGGLSASYGIANAATLMSSVFLLGLLVLPFAPETRGQALPDGEADPA